MKNYVQPGHTVTAVAPTGGILSGQGLLFGALFGIASFSADEGAEVEIVTTGVFDLPKAPNAVLGAGARVAWDTSAVQVVAPATGMVPIGVALAAAGNGATTVRVRLDGVATQVAA
ncbi:MAG: DUF2190 family protein [Alphaproteobacteria bacterium]|nr:DUF2190 family protein [Alphaproteobacteria bacterium]